MINRVSTVAAAFSCCPFGIDSQEVLDQFLKIFAVKNDYSEEKHTEIKPGLLILDRIQAQIICKHI